MSENEDPEKGGETVEYISISSFFENADDHILSQSLHSRGFKRQLLLGRPTEELAFEIRDGSWRMVGYIAGFPQIMVLA